MEIKITKLQEIIDDIPQRAKYKITLGHQEVGIFNTFADTLYLDENTIKELGEKINSVLNVAK